MKLYSVTDGYVDYLRMEHSHVYSNKENTRKNMRKYLGAVFEIGAYKYFIPLSSAKESDYIIKNGERVIRRDSFVILRIVSKEGEKRELKGTLRVANMIPVPESELIPYDADHEEDAKYKDLIQKELEYIRKHEDRITKRAKLVYQKKVSDNNEPVTNCCLDYKDLERLHDEWMKNVTE